jgi:hypothetical protein
MPRKSTAELTLIVPRVDGRPTRLQPPDDLSPNERQQFVDLIDSTAPEHFRASDLPVLCEFVRTVCLARHAAKMLARTGGPIAEGELNPWFSVLQRSQRMMSIFSTRLRLTPASRSSPRTIGRMPTRASAYDRPSAYDVMTDDAG